MYIGLRFENDRPSANFWATFFHGSSYALILTKLGWATFWATLSPTHLVTLLDIQNPFT
jgi:hypothetical protein